jgi:hypothetical protein
MATTFEVSRVERATTLLRMPAKASTSCLQNRRVEAMGANVSLFLPAEGHGLTRAAHTAYALHYPLILSPDVVWLAIAHGFATHVNANAERLSGKFVRHGGRETITVQRDDFVKGSSENPWPEAFSVFSDAVAAQIGRQRDLVVCDFSTTGPCERAASEIVLLDAMQSYFNYDVLTLCGIPEITLEGTVDDWRAIRRRAHALEEYELAWWTAALGPVLDELVATAEGRVDTAFWRTFFKHQDGSGGPWVRGWINVLFPYLRRGEGAGRDPKGERLVRNDNMASWRKGLDADHGGGPTPLEIPSGLSCVPFEWRYLGNVFPMEFVGGFVGVGQHEATLAVRPAIGWAVRDALRPAQPADESLALRTRAPGIRSEVTLIAGRISGDVPLTADDFVALRARIDRYGEAAGLRLTCAPAGNLETVNEFPEFPVVFRIVVGVLVASVDPGSSRNLEITELRQAIDTAHTIPETTWRAIAEILPSRLGRTAALYLTVLGGRTSGAIRFGDIGGSISVAEATNTRRTTAAVDVSPQAHDARVEAAGKRGIDGASARYLLSIGWEGDAP